MRASTSVATLYHYAFGWVAPYGWTSLPKVLGGVGGVLLMLGCAGLWRLRQTRHLQHVDAGSAGMDLGFIALLFTVAASGLALALARGQPAAAASSTRARLPGSGTWLEPTTLPRSTRLMVCAMPFFRSLALSLKPLSTICCWKPPSVAAR